MKYLTEYIDIKNGLIYGDDVDAENWIEAQKICSKRRFSEIVIGEHILTIEISDV